MYGRCLTRGKANLTEIDVALRDNIHEHQSFLYGFAQDKTLSDDIKMALTYIVYLECIMLLNAYQINQTLQTDDLNSHIDKFTKSESINTLISDIELFCLKYIRAEDAKTALNSDILLKYLICLNGENNSTLNFDGLFAINRMLIKIISNMGLNYDLVMVAEKYPKTIITNSISSNLVLFYKKYIIGNEIKMLSALGTFDLGRVISEFDGLFIDDLSELSIDDITRKKPPIYGLFLANKIQVKAYTKSALNSNMLLIKGYFVKGKSNMLLAYRDVFNIIKGFKLGYLKSTLKLSNLNLNNNQLTRFVNNFNLSPPKLKLGLVKKTKLIELNDLYISDLNGLTIDDISYTKIY